MKKKTIAILVVCALIGSGGAFGGVQYYRNQKDKKTVVDVTPVVNMMGYDYGSEMMMDGTVIAGSKQNIRLEQNKVVQEVLVHVGDTVTVGTPLIAYDMTALELEVQEKKDAVAVAEDDIRVAQKELARLQALRPSEQRPSYNFDIELPEEEPENTETMPMIQTTVTEAGITDPTETADITTDITVPEFTETTDDTETEISTETTSPPEPTEFPSETTDTTDGMQIASVDTALEGDGSENQPYLFFCAKDTVITAELLTWFHQNGSHAIFMVEGGYQWMVDGTRLPESVSDWNVSEAVVIAEDGTLSVDFQKTVYGIFQIAGSGETDDAEWPDDEFYDDSWFDYSTDDSEDYLYTTKELTQMIQKQQSKIKTLEFQKKSADLAYEAALKKKDSGLECSLIDGVVTEIHTDLTEKDTEKPFMVIQGSGGFLVQGTISEWNLNKVQVGSVITGISYDTGESMMLTVTEVDTVPAANSYVPYNENPSNSMYQFQAETEENYDISVGSWLSLSLTEETDSSHFYLPLQYVREENGRYYVMKADEDKRLAKQYVQTGKIRYGSEIEIIDGIQETDLICFPYGKNVKIGVRTRQTDEVVW